MTHPRPLVSVVDDDESVRESLPDLLRELGYTARAFSSAEEFLASQALDESKCLILDVAMPRMSGPALQQELKRRGKAFPIIFITANRNETVRSQVLAEGAAECLYKPFSDTALLTAIHAALEKRT
jgi:FixJ family two-component response regulator